MAGTDATAATGAAHYPIAGAVFGSADRAGRRLRRDRHQLRSAAGYADCHGAAALGAEPPQIEADATDRGDGEESAFVKVLKLASAARICTFGEHDRTSVCAPPMSSSAVMRKCGGEAGRWCLANVLRVDRIVYSNFQRFKLEWNNRTPPGFLGKQLAVTREFPFDFRFTYSVKFRVELAMAKSQSPLEAGRCRPILDSPVVPSATPAACRRPGWCGGQAGPWFTPSASIGAGWRPGKSQGDKFEIERGKALPREASDTYAGDEARDRTGRVGRPRRGVN